MPRLDVNGASLHYTVSGDGPPVVLIAGVASDSASWAPIHAQLAAHFTVIAIDNRSTGQTRDPGGALSIQQWADDVAALCDVLNQTRCSVIGHSLGGMIGLQLAKTRPDLVQRLGLMSCAPAHLPRNAHLFRHLQELRKPDRPPALWLHAFLPWLFHPRFFEDPRHVETTIAAALAYPHAQTAADMARQIAAVTEVSDLHQVTCPVLSVVGAHDLLTPPDLIEDALRDLRNLRNVMIRDAGHSVHWDQPEAVTKALLAFLREDIT